MVTEEQLVALATRYGVLQSVPLSTVSSRVLQDGKVFPRLAEGRGSITMSRAERAWQWFADHWPSEEPWPDEIPYPVPLLEPSA